MSSLLSVKNQVTLPKVIRDYLGVSPGERVSFEPLPDGRVAIAAANPKDKVPTDPVSAMRGSASRKQKTENRRRDADDAWRRLEPAVILVDSNVLIDVMQDDPKWAEWSASQLQRARATQKLAINAVILVERSVNYETLDEIKRYLDAVGIVTKPLPEEAAFAGGHAVMKYRRRKGVKTGVLPDFLIDAHAQASGYTLLTRDVARYKTYFPDLALIHP